jgi:hypothetical protein
MENIPTLPKLYYEKIGEALLEAYISSKRDLLRGG